MTKQLRIGFMGTADFAVPILHDLCQAGYRPSVIYTQPPRPKGRGMKTIATPIGLVAQQLEIPTKTPLNFRNPETIAELQHSALDLVIVIAYGLILPTSVLETPRLGCINVHPSILPRWRGATPLQRALEAGDTQGGVSIIQMDTGIDTGPILAQESYLIPEKINAQQWQEFQAQKSSEILLPLLKNIEQTTQKKQNTLGITYAGMIHKNDLAINFHESAQDIMNKARAFAPKPGIWCLWAEKRLRLFSVNIIQHNGAEFPPGTILNNKMHIQTSSGIVQPEYLQLEGRKAMSIDDFLRGTTIPEGFMLKGLK